MRARARGHQGGGANVRRGAAGCYEQTAESKATNPAASFVETLKSLLLSGRCRVVNRNERLNGAATAPEIGWCDKDQVIFEVQSACREVRRFAEHDLLPWPDLFDRLAQAKLCEPPTIDEKTNVARKGTRVRAGGTRGYYLVFKREVFAEVPLEPGEMDEESRREIREHLARADAESEAIAEIVCAPGGRA